MKNITVSVIGLAMLALSSASTASMKYECWTYVNDKPDRMTTIVADNNKQAVQLVKAKFKKLGRTWDYVKCK